MAELKAPQAGEFLLYESDDGHTRIECRFAGESLWLSQALMAELFQTTKQNIAKHLKAIFAEGELAEDSVVNQWLTTAADGKNYRVTYYKLDAILIACARYAVLALFEQTRSFILAQGDDIIEKSKALIERAYQEN